MLRVLVYKHEALVSLLRTTTIRRKERNVSVRPSLAFKEHSLASYAILCGSYGELQVEGPLLMVVWSLGTGYGILAFDLPKNTTSL